ncbi:660_t:CDS:2 [Diversispora eburnea]|uniref:660_t:CDS:1 n=1 Tax=Diversispora eburnea TaxID=1213867 RepID=A0A9N8VZ71_9GLOM|nr:660_t:CDS:2 [Diversispora eburnea]
MSNMYTTQDVGYSRYMTNSRRSSGGNSILGPRSNTQRPQTLKKSRPRRTSLQDDQISQEMRPVLYLFDVYSRKIYIEGYLCRKVISPSQNQQDWLEYYVELCGPTLSLWKVLSLDSELPEVSQTPIIINIFNYATEICSPISDGTSQRINVFLVNAGQGDNFYLQTPNERALNLWVSAIRLSCYEGSRLQEVYTATLFKRPELKDYIAGTVLIKGKLEGYLQVQFNYSDEPKKYWVVVSDHRAEDKKKKSDLAYTRGQALFYETKKSKKPFMTLANVLQTYAIYPDNPTLIEKTNQIRVEGNLYPTKSTDNKFGDFVILTTESINQLSKWVIGFFDSFKLYGRPKELLYDFKNPISPFFAVPTERNNMKLFLDLIEVEHVEMRSIQNDNLSDNVIRQRPISGESTSSSSHSSSPSTLKSINSTTRSNFNPNVAQGSQKASSFIKDALIDRKSQYGQIKRNIKQIASSDDDSENSIENYENESDEPFDNPAVKRNTQKNTKIIIGKENKSTIGSKKIIESPVFGESDLMSEILTAVSERTGEQEDETQNKFKRVVTFKNQPEKSKLPDKKTKPVPLLSESEDSEESSKSDEGSSNKVSNKNNVKIITKPAAYSRQVSIVEEVTNPNRPSQASYSRQINIVEEVTRGRSKGKKPIRQEQSESEPDEILNKDDDETESAESADSDDDNKDIVKETPNNSINSLKKTDLLDKSKTDLNQDFNSLTLNLPEKSDDKIESTSSEETETSEKEVANKTRKVFKPTIRKESKARQESTSSEDETTESSEDDMINKERKVFKPTKQKDKRKKASLNKSSESSGSDDDNSNSEDSEEEPLAVYVDDAGYNSNYGRSNFNTRPRSVSPNYIPGQRWAPPPGSGGYYADNMGYPMDYRRSFVHRNDYDDDRASIASFGNRSRSAMGHVPMPPHQRHLSGGQMDYMRDSFYSDDGYYDDRGNPFVVPNHIRPNSLLDTLPQSQPSAREQELLARERGEPLINIPERQKDPQTGLVGAITAREHQRKARGPGLAARQAEFERERAFERERERRLMEQRQQVMMAEREREREYMYRQSYVAPPGGPNRYYNNQQYLDPYAGHNNQQYLDPYAGHNNQQHLDPYAAVGSSMPPTQPRSSRVPKGRRTSRETEYN